MVSEQARRCANAQRWQKEEGRAGLRGRKVENEQPGSPSQAPVKTRRAGACLQAACSLPLAPVSCRRSLSVEANPRLQLACRTLGLENRPLPPALCWVTSPSGTLFAGTHPTSSCTQKCYAHWNGGIVAGISIPFRAVFTGFSRLPELWETIAITVTSVLPHRFSAVTPVVLCLQVRVFWRTGSSFAQKEAQI